MSRTITALFDTRADAEAAKNRLEAAAIDVSHVDLTDKAAAGYADDRLAGSGTTSPERQGFWASLKGAFTPGDDRHLYEEGIRRGGTLLTATVDDDKADTAVDILDNANSVDIDGRAEDWRASGWAGAPAATAAYGAADRLDQNATGRADEEVIPVVEETLRVGKREVDRGGVRVRSYLVETPVSEQVTLRDERVSVERRSVSDGTVPADAFRERTIEMTETAEEAVIAKDARVVEEVVVRKTADDRTETVSDTVRRTEVEVDDVAGTAGATRTGTAGASFGDKVAGVAKEGYGKVTGNDALVREGEAQKGKLGY